MNNMWRKNEKFYICNFCFQYFFNSVGRHEDRNLNGVRTFKAPMLYPPIDGNLKTDMNEKPRAI